MKKADYIAVLLFMCLFMGIACACNNSTQKQSTALEFGLHFTTPLDEESPGDHCAYRADTNTFFIDNVTLTFYFGWYAVNDSDGRNIPEAELYFYNKKQPTVTYPIRKINDYISDEYRCYPVYDDHYRITEIRFEHSESITVPQEVFTGEEGMIYFVVKGEDVNNRDNRKEEYKGYITSCCIYYHRDGNKVVLSCQDFADE